MEEVVAENMDSSSDIAAPDIAAPDIVFHVAGERKKELLKYNIDLKCMLVRYQCGCWREEIFLGIFLESWKEEVVR